MLKLLLILAVVQVVYFDIYCLDNDDIVALSVAVAFAVAVGAKVIVAVVGNVLVTAPIVAVKVSFVNHAKIVVNSYS